MILKRNFLRGRINPFSVKKRKVTAGIVLGVIWAVLFYNFLHLIRIFAIYSHSAIGYDFEPVFLKPEEAFLYNFLFGFVSVFSSFSIVYNYWFERPNQVHEKHNYKRKFFLNQQRTTNWFFSYWFVNIAFLLSCFAFYFSEINFYDEYKYFIFIFIIAFTSQIWSSIRPMIKTKKLLWLVVTFLLTFMTSFIISTINFINPENFQEKLLQSNFIYKHNVHVVESSIYRKKSHSSLNYEIVVPDTVEDALFFEREKMEYEDLPAAIFRTRDYHSEFEVPYMRYTLFIDKRVTMSYIYEIKKKLLSVDVDYLYFSVKKEGTDVPFYYKSKYVFGIYLPSNILEGDSEIKNKVYIKFLGNNNYLLKNKKVKKEDVANELKTIFLEKGTHSIRLLLNKNTSFEEYFDILLSTQNIIKEMREEYSKNKYNTAFDSLNRTVKGTVKEIYYWHVYESIVD